MRVLLYDLETAPARGWFWPNRLYEQDIIEVDQDSFILGFGYVWAHLPNEYHWVGQPDFKAWKKDYRNDNGVVKELYRLVNEADYAVAHNGKGFDFKVANASFFLHGLPPPSQPKFFDTKQIAKKHFKFPSNKLDEIGRITEQNRKLAHTGKKLWFDCMKRVPEAWEMMEDYCIQDVKLLKDIWDKFLPWMDDVPNWNLDGDRPKCCPACGSGGFRKWQVAYEKTSARQKYRCEKPSCRHVWRGESVARVSSDFSGLGSK